MQEKKGAQRERGLFARSAESRNESKPAVSSAILEVQGETEVELAWDSEAKYQMNQ